MMVRGQAEGKTLQARDRHFSGQRHGLENLPFLQWERDCERASERHMHACNELCDGMNFERGRDQVR
jgi:hypothetical protein